MINVLIVDDSPTARLILEKILTTDPDIEVAGTVASGEDALRFLESGNKKPDVITMDVVMPGIDGFETTRRIMETVPTPIIIVTATYEPDEMAGVFKAIEAGAVAMLPKPALNRPRYKEEAEEIRKAVRIMSEVKVVKRWNRSKRKVNQKSSPPAAEGIQMIVIGASTGGPRAIQHILKELPHDLPVPILTVQHINPGFAAGMAEWLGKSTGFPVYLATNGERCRPGNVYLAPDDRHLGISSNGVIELSNAEPEKGLRPSVSYLFRSAARSFGRQVIGIILTGMGTDGADGLLMMAEKGAPTIVQDEESSVVFGMPQAAIKIGAASFVLGIDDIPRKILRLLQINSWNNTARIVNEVKENPRCM